MVQATKETTQPKDVALGFLKMAFLEGKPKEAAARFLVPQYRQHNPTVPDGAEGFVQFATQMAKQFPQMSYDIKRVLQDGDHVVIHAHLKTHPKDRGMAVVDIFRVSSGKVVEHWDVIQSVPEMPVNHNTMF